MSNAESSERYRLVESIFQRAADLPQTLRGALLDSACGSDPELRVEVEALLAHLDTAPAGFLELPAHGLGRRASADDGCPQRIGAYTIIGLLGRGGMGSMYEAEQAQPRRRVALKVIRGDAYAEDTLRRFRHEADVLGQLQHPGIARIYEFGTGQVWFHDVPTATQPFFAMELVSGAPLAKFATARRLDRRAILELMARVCDAVHHAHQKGVIHRDLKPSNIIVDEEGQPKVLDFGVARITRADAHTTSEHTSAGQLLGTIPYMSPEQLAGAAHVADTRSDVYALGVVAYELLAGRLPYDVAGLPAAQAIGVRAEQDARPAGAVRRELRGDVEVILGKA